MMRKPDAILQARLRDSERWRDSSGTEGAPFVAIDEDLSGLDLRGACFVEAMLFDCLFTGSNLAGADLYRADLSGSDFTGAYLHGANLARSQATAASFVRAHLAQAKLTRAEWTRCDLRELVADGAYGDRTSWLRCDLTNASILNVRLSRCSLLGSILQAANLDSSLLCRPTPTEGSWHSQS
jgi:uncharacterized protein YjbI with pentapeptide repeats